MNDLDFLEGAGHEANAVLTILLPDSTVSHIYKVSPFQVLERCPLLYHAFEYGTHCVRQANIEAPSMSAVVSFLRYLYTGNYLTDQQEDDQCSLLLHAQVYKVAEDFDVPELQVAAYVNFTRGTEFACCLPAPPPGLCETIHFVYKHLACHQSRQEHSLVDTLLHYCISTFKYHKLHEKSDFLQVVFDTPKFHQDLCHTSMKRDFQDECADEIMRLPVCSPTPYSGARLNKRALGDFLYEIWYDAEVSSANADSDSDIEKNPTKRRKSDVEDTFTLVHRPKAGEETPTFSESESSTESSSDEEGFMLVHRPRLNAKASPLMPRSSPEIPPSNPEVASAPSDEVDSTPDSKIPLKPCDKDDWVLDPAEDSDWSFV